MPSVPALISGGISLGIIASFISGVYYVLIAGLKWVGKLQASLQIAEEKRADKWSCARCGRDLSLVKTGPSRRVKCARCSVIVCRNCCSKTSATSWICSNCRKYRDIHLQTGEWFYEQLKKRFYSTVATVSGNANQDGDVRDFMERILEEMVGGKLDNVSLRPLSTHPEYVKFSETHHDELALTLAKFSLALQIAISDKILPDSDSPSSIHEELKEIIKRIIKDAMTLPSLQNYSNGSINKESMNGEVDEIEKKSYEDILATAVINKIVERYQNELYNYEISNSRVSLRDTNCNIVRRRKLRKHRLKAGANNSNSSDSESSAAYTNDDYSWSESNRTDPLSLTIEECIEEVVTKYSSDEDPEEPDSEFKHFLSGLNFRKRQRAPFPEFGMDVVDSQNLSSSSEEENAIEEGEQEGDLNTGVEVVSTVESWEENWLFQRRRLKTACLSQSMPVPMLVPNPSEDEPRARIGDVDIDETSDLSDCSDSVLEDIIDGSDPDIRGVTKLSIALNQKTSSDENSDSEDEFFLTNYNRNVIKSLDKMKPIVNGVCNGNIGNNLIANGVNIIHQDEDTDTDLISSALHSTSPSQRSPHCNINEARNNELIVNQVDSGEGSLEMQQDRDYTVEYDAPVQVHINNQTVKTDLIIDDHAINNTDSSPENNSVPVTKENNTQDLQRNKPMPKPRNTQIAQKEENIEKSSKTNNAAEDEPTEDGKENLDTILITPPRPGTIAEREHLKWQKAVPLTNNPYSKENIERRRRERLLLSRQSSGDTSVEFPELTGANDSSVVHIDCSGRKPDYKQYGRDYYINNGGGVKKESEKMEKEDEKQVEMERTRKDSCGKSSNNIQNVNGEDKPQVSVRVEVEVGRWSNSSSSTSNGTTVSSIETRTRITDLKDDEQHLTTVSTTTASANNDDLNDKQHQVTTISTWKSNNNKNNNNIDNKNYIPLPSVKELAKQFSSSDKIEQVSPVISTATQKRLDVQTSPIKQVHSLTARCISKEFREGLRAANQPKNYQVKPIEKYENNSGNISDDSGTASPTPSGGNPKLYNSIAFWEQMKSSRQ